MAGDNDDAATALLSRADAKRRRRELIAVGVASFTLVAFVLAQTRLPALSSHTSLLSNLVVILLFDLSFLLLGLMLLLVGRNLAKAIFERRRGPIGSKLQFRLVFGFIAVALVPSAFLLYVAGTFLEADINSWFNPEYEHVLDASLEIAKVYYLNSANNAAHFARVLSETIAADRLLEPANHDALRRYVAKAQQEYNLGTIEVFNAHRNLLMLELSPRIPTGIGVSPESAIITGTLAGHSLTRTDPLGKADVIRGSAPIYATVDSDTVAGAVVVDYFLPKSLAASAAGISHSFEDYFQLRILHQPILRSYVLALLLIGLAVVLLASWFGIYLARGITGSIKLLAEGTQAVAGGNLNYEIPPVGDDEIGQLVASFNRMTGDLRTSRAELERRRRYTETLLRNVSAGVVGMDPEGVITAINPWAEWLLGRHAAEVLGRDYAECFPHELVVLLEELLAGPRAQEVRSSLKLEAGGGEAELMMTASPLGDELGGDLGTVLFFEDVSQIAKIERMEAWREVARRIAHEIKNPLTPIQLSAERLRRNLGTGSDGDRSLLDECTHTIISEVADLKRLVNEFASLARMPQLRPVPGDLNALAEEVVGHFREANPAIEFGLELAPELPAVALDREALKRALVNLLDNAVAAVTTTVHLSGGPRITVATTTEPARALVTLEIADNGPGVAPRDRARIFEPYFSTKRGGTGLGLAIVSSIVTEHHGLIRVRDNKPHGSRFIIEFPLRADELPVTRNAMGTR